MLRLWFWHLLAFAALLLPGVAVPQSVPQRIVAVGDLHGDYEAWRAIAGKAGLVDSTGHWSGGKTTLVQAGDIVDRGPDSLKIIRDLMKLQKEAPKRGGRVIVLVGNHEAMMMTGDLRYVHPGEYAAFADGDSKARRDRAYELNKPTIEASYRARTPDMSSAAIKDAWFKEVPLGMLEHQAAWKPTGELGKWMLANPAVAKLGNSLFVHGGISSAYAAVPVEEINGQVRAALKAQDANPTSIINSPHGPLWYRGLISRGDGDEATVAPIPAGAAAALTIDQEIDLVLNSYGVARIVVGHTPAVEGIVQGYGGKLWRIDSANSRAYGGTPSYLEIIGDQVTPHKVTRPPGNAWGK
jgi:hypothetical protein